MIYSIIFTSMTHGYLFYTLGYNPIVLVLVFGNTFTWLLCPLDVTSFFYFAKIYIMQNLQKYRVLHNLPVILTQGP